MSDATVPHKIFPHGQPEPFGDGLWEVRGSMAIPLVRKMVVHRLPSGGLLLHSVVAMDDDGMRALEALGRPEILVVPHPMHTLDTAFYARRYPDLKIVAAADAAARLEGRVTVHGRPADILSDHGIRVSEVPGMKYSEVVLDVPSGDGRALLFTDLVGRSASKNLMMRLLGPPAGAGVARIVRWRQIADRAQVARYLRDAAETASLKAVMAAHSTPVTSDPGAFLRTAADQLAR